MNERWRERLPVILGFGSPCLAAAITMAAFVVAGDAAVLPLILNAVLAGLGSAAGGFLRRDELAFRVIYTIPSGVGGVILYVLFLACFVFLFVPAL